MAQTNVQAFSGDVEIAGGLSITGSVTSTGGIDKVNLATDGTSANRPVIFTTGTTGAQPLKTDAGLTYNPSTNKLTTTTFSGALAGNATTATTLATVRTINGVDFDGSENIVVEPYISDDNTGDPTCNIVFTQDSGAGHKRLYEDTGLTYDNTANKLTATTFTGALAGNATTATTLATVRTINGVDFDGSENIVVEPYISDDNTGDPTCNIVFTQNSTNGYKRLYEDTGLTYDNTANKLTTTTFSGALSGNATTATGLAGPIFYAYNNSNANGTDISIYANGTALETRISYFLTDTTVNLGSRYFTTGANQGRFVASTAGTYVFAGSSMFRSSNAAGFVFVFFKKNGSTFQPVIDGSNPSILGYIILDANFQTVTIANTYLQLDANDYIELLLMTSSSGSVGMGTTNGFSCFSGYRIS